MRGSIFGIFGEAPGQAWKVKEELKYETCSSDWEEQAARFVCVAAAAVSYHSSSAELPSPWGKPEISLGRKIKSKAKMKDKCIPIT